MKKTILFCSALIGASTSGVFAEDGENYFKSGVYAGASVGYSYMGSQASETFVAPLLTFNGNPRGKDKSFGGIAEALIGARYFFNNRFFAGLELSTSWDENEIEKKFTFTALGAEVTTATKLKSSYKVSPALVIGKQFSDRWAGFLKLGGTFTRFRVSHALSDGAGAPVIESFNVKKTGFIGALGAEYALNKNFSTIASISYEYYGKINRNLKIDFGSPNDKNQITLKPSYVTAKLGLIYRF